MKAAKVLLPVLLLLLIGLSPGPALAADSDFEVDANASRTLGPKGGDVRLQMAVTNTGATDITWMSAVVSTQAGFSPRRTKIAVRRTRSATP